MELHKHQQSSLRFSKRSLVAPRRRGCKLVESSCSLSVEAAERNQAELVVVWGRRPVHRHTQPGCREQDILGLLQTHTELQLLYESLRPPSNTLLALFPMQL